jgi:hypothetical protein
MISQIESEIRPGTFVGSSARCVEQNQASHGPLRTEVARWERDNGETYFSGQLDSSPMHAGVWTKPNGDFNHASVSCHHVTDIDFSDPSKIIVTTTSGEITIAIFEEQA